MTTKQIGVAVLDDKILATGEETLKEIVGDEKIEAQCFSATPRTLWPL